MDTIIYIVMFENGEIDSVWSTPELAENRIRDKDPIRLLTQIWKINSYEPFHPLLGRI